AGGRRTRTMDGHSPRPREEATVVAAGIGAAAAAPVAQLVDLVLDGVVRVEGDEETVVVGAARSAPGQAARVPTHVDVAVEERLHAGRGVADEGDGADDLVRGRVDLGVFETHDQGSGL